MKGSWKTTMVGILTLVGAIVTGAIALLDSDPTTVVDLTTIIQAITGLGLMVARDNKVTSEQAGAK
jgi:hypothetical protein